MNLQTCQFGDSDSYAFCNRIHPVMCSLIVDAQAVFGLKGNDFTLEVYCRENEILDPSRTAKIDDLKQHYFYSPTFSDPCRPIYLKHRSPAIWAWKRGGIAGQCRIDDDPKLFEGQGGTTGDLYFNRICTVPIFSPCTKDLQGVLVLTSMQQEPFAEDAIDTLQFVSSLIAQYIVVHNRCVEEAVVAGRLDFRAYGG